MLIATMTFCDFIHGPKKGEFSATRFNRELKKLKGGLSDHGKRMKGQRSFLYEGSK